MRASKYVIMSKKLSIVVLNIGHYLASREILVSKFDRILLFTGFTIFSIDAVHYIKGVWQLNNKKKFRLT